MKKYTLYGMFSLAAALFIWACSNDDNAAPRNNAPIFEDDTVSAPEDIADTESITTLIANDPDGDDITFEITKNDNDLFEITEGDQLSLAAGKSLDFETSEEHTLTVRATDGKNNTTATVTVVVIDRPEENGEEGEEQVQNPPAMADQSFEVPENTTAEAFAKTVEANDPDGDALTFSLDQDESGLFTLSEDGELGLGEGKTLDFESATSYVITVSVTDQTDTVTAQVTINVTNVNEAPEVDAQEFEVSENIADDQPIGEPLQWTDVDTETVTFAITANAQDAEDNDLFEIDETGQLSLITGRHLDYETSTSHNITVSVSDGEFTTEAQVTLTVLDGEDPLAEDPASFITKWTTTVDLQSITIGLNPDYNYSFTIDWGDGQVEQVSGNTNPNHQYAKAGTYLVAIKGIFPAMYSDSDDIPVNVRERLRAIVQWGETKWQTMRFAFYDYPNLEYEATDVPNLSQVESLSNMFNGCISFNGDVSGWDTGNITDIGYMFQDAVSFVGHGLEDWDVSKVADFTGMFINATAFTGEQIGGWNTGNALNMNGMFFGATDFNGAIGGWDVSKVQDINDMFRGATKFNQDLGGWDVSKVESFAFIFDGAIAFEGQGLEEWTVPPQVQSTAFMFRNCTAFNGDISGWDVSNVENMRQMLENASSFNRNIGEWDLSAVNPGFIDGLLDNTGLTFPNYNNTLVGWAGNPNTPDNLIVGAEGLICCGFNPLAARLSLIQKGWTINGDQQFNFCP